MGTWSEDTFGNDVAADWALSFSEKPGMDSVSELIHEVNECSEYLDSYLSCCCLAACEVIARLKGNWGIRDSFSEQLDLWIEKNPQSPSQELIAEAVKAITKIAGPNSELAELWDEDGYNSEWHEQIDDLLERVKN